MENKTKEKVSLYTDDKLRERIKLVFAKNNTSFTAKCGTGTALQSKFQRQLSKSAITYEVIAYVLEWFPNVSAEWLFRGEGPYEKSTDGIVVYNQRTSGTNNTVVGSGNVSSGNQDIEDVMRTNRVLQDALSEMTRMSRLIEKLNQ